MLVFTALTHSVECVRLENIYFVTSSYPFHWCLDLFKLASTAPQSRNIVCAISDYIQTTFFYLGRFLKKLADDHCCSITKDSIYDINHMYKQPFTTVVDWPEVWKYLLRFIFADTAFLLGGAVFPGWNDWHLKQHTISLVSSSNISHGIQLQ